MATPLFLLHTPPFTWYAKQLIITCCIWVRANKAAPMLTAPMLWLDFILSLWLGIVPLVTWVNIGAQLGRLWFNHHHVGSYCLKPDHMDRYWLKHGHMDGYCLKYIHIIGRCWLIIVQMGRYRLTLGKVGGYWFNQSNECILDQLDQTGGYWHTPG